MLNEGMIGARNFLRGGSGTFAEESEDRGRQAEDASLGPRQLVSRSQANPEQCSRQRGTEPASNTISARGSGQSAGREAAPHQPEPLGTTGPMAEAADRQPSGGGTLLGDGIDIVPDTQSPDGPQGPAQEAVGQGLQHCAQVAASVRPPAAGAQIEPGMQQLQMADAFEQGGDTVPDSRSPGGPSRSLRPSREMQLAAADVIIPESPGSGDALDPMRVASTPGSGDGSVQADMELDAVHQPDEPASEAEDPLENARDSSGANPMLPALQPCVAPQCSRESQAISQIAAAGDRQVSEPAKQSAEQAAAVGQQEVRRSERAKLPEAAQPGSSAGSKASQQKEAPAQGLPDQPAMAPAARMQVSTLHTLAASVSLAGTPQS